MRRHLFLVTAVVAATALGCGLATGAQAATPAASGWGKAKVLPGPGSTNAVPDTISCTSPGNCVAGGAYSATTGQQAFVVNQTNGVWGKVAEVPGTAGLNTGGAAWVDSISCPSAGNCSAGGLYSAGSLNDEQAFVATEKKGVWGKAEEMPGTGGLNRGDTAAVDSLSCASAGNCSAGGIYLDEAGSYEAFIGNETAGVWAKAEEVPGMAKLNTGGDADVQSISCPTAGSCVAIGNDVGSSGDEAFVVKESSGVWGTATTVPGLAALSGDGTSGLQNVSCPSAGNCGAIGTEWNGTSNIDEAFVVNMTSGTWGKPEKVPGLNALSTGGVSSWSGAEDCYYGNCLSISCPTAGNCGATGSYIGHTPGPQGFVVNETNGVWGNAQAVPGLAALNVGRDAEFYGISCAAPGDCAAGGQYGSKKNYSDVNQAFVVSETGGVWGSAAEVPGTASLDTGSDGLLQSVDCATAGHCSAIGVYGTTPNAVTGGFVATEPG
jgi:hypothetical protein